MRLVRGRDLRAMLLASSPLDASRRSPCSRRSQRHSTQRTRSDWFTVTSSPATSLSQTTVGPSSPTLDREATNATTNLSPHRPARRHCRLRPARTSQRRLGRRTSRPVLACLRSVRVPDGRAAVRSRFRACDAVGACRGGRAAPSALRQGLAAAFDEAIAVGLAKEPDSRFASCLQLLEHAAAGTAGNARGPFVGLAPFDAEDAFIFFGRERLVAELTDRVLTGRLSRTS